MLDIACGNGLTSRRLPRGAARVVAFDFFEQMIRLAKDRGGNAGIDYRVVDATDADALNGRGPGRFDTALCNMALMDGADVRPLMEALSSLLRPAGRFVFSVLHPYFNNPAIVETGELQDRGGEVVTTYSVKVSCYLTPYIKPA